jgi:hypothetical protein
MSLMFTVDDFLVQYETYSDEELMHIHSNPDDHSPEAEEAAKRLLNRRGGLEAAKERISQKQAREAALAKKRWESTAVARAEEKKIKPGTIYGSVLGGILATLVGTAL